MILRIVYLRVRRWFLLQFLQPGITGRVYILHRCFNPLGGADRILLVYQSGEATHLRLDVRGHCSSWVTRRSTELSEGDKSRLIAWIVNRVQGNTHVLLGSRGHDAAFWDMYCMDDASPWKCFIHVRGSHTMQVWDVLGCDLLQYVNVVCGME
jgi:hypothetical protein